MFIIGSTDNALADIDEGAGAEAACLSSALLPLHCLVLI